MIPLQSSSIQFSYFFELIFLSDELNLSKYNFYFIWIIFDPYINKLFNWFILEKDQNKYKCSYCNETLSNLLLLKVSEYLNNISIGKSKIFQILFNINIFLKRKY